MTRSLLIVDDDVLVRSSLRRLLERRGYLVHEAEGAASAYAQLDEHRIDAVLLDLNMPDMRGDVLFFLIVRRWPELAGRIMIMSGAIDIDDDTPSELQRCPRLAKPFAVETLCETVERVCAAADAERVRRQGNGGC